MSFQRGRTPSGGAFSCRFENTIVPLGHAARRRLTQCFVNGWRLGTPAHVTFAQPNCLSSFPRHPCGAKDEAILGIVSERRLEKALRSGLSRVHTFLFITQKTYMSA